ncbi:MAG: tetratricopeptide repeat protein [Spirochaetes bacterium]|nr:tetratricopeptide repeat protein [Spirochaetota bacterium]
MNRNGLVRLVVYFLIILSCAACVSVSETTILDSAPLINPLVAEQAGMESLLVSGNPSSLSSAVETASSSALLGQDQKLVYTWLSFELAKLVYPELMDSSTVLRDVPQTDPLVRMFVDARNGRLTQSANTANALQSLLPALVVFRFRTRDAANQALDALQVFDLLDQASSLAELIRGMAYERSGDPENAFIAYSRAVELAPDNYPAQLALSSLLVARGQAESALELLSSVDQLLVRTLVFRRAKAKALYGAGNYVEAGPLIANVLLEEPTNSEFVLMRAHILVESKEYRQAQPLLEVYARVDANKLLYLLLRARVALEYSKDRRNALVYLRRALERYPSDISLALYTASVLSSGGNSQEQEEAVTLARSVLERNPDSREANRILLTAEAKAGNFEAAAALADQLLTAGLQLTDYELVYKAYRNAGRNSDLNKLAVDWLAAAPESEAARIAYLSMLIDTGKSLAAAELIQQYLAVRGSAGYRSSLYWLSARLQTAPEAVLAALRTALVEDSMNVDALLGMFDYYAGQRDYQRAAFYLKQAYAIAPNRPEVASRRSTMNQLGIAIP